MSGRRRVVVTGIGLVTSLGIGREANWEAALAGRSGARPITSFEPLDTRTTIACEVQDFDPADHMDKRVARRMDRFAQFAVAAGRMALEDAGLAIDATFAPRIGALVGSGIGGLDTFVQQVTNATERGPDRLSPLFIPMVIANMAAAQVSMELGLQGPLSTISTACASGNHALGDATEMIRSGRADAMLAGGAEASVTRVGVGAFNAMRALSTRNDDPEGASRPFDKGRDGFVMGEGCGVLVLEALEHAEARGATPLAELVGYGATADASHITLPAPGGIGAVRAARIALAKAGMEPSEIGHVNAHATSTPEGDKAELQAIRTIFGDHAPNVAVTANKSMLGHTLGAAGAIEAIVTILSIREGCIPPTLNLEDPDDEGAGLDLVSGSAVRRDVEAAISNSFGFGGQNTALVFRRFAA